MSVDLDRPCPCGKHSLRDCPCKDCSCRRVKALREYWGKQTPEMIDARMKALVAKQKALCRPGQTKRNTGCTPHHPSPSHYVHGGTSAPPPEPSAPKKVEAQTHASRTPRPAEQALWHVEIRSFHGWQDFYAGPDEDGAREAALRAIDSGLDVRYKGPHMSDWEVIEK